MFSSSVSDLRSLCSDIKFLGESVNRLRTVELLEEKEKEKEGEIVAIYEGFIGTTYEVEANDPDEAYEKLLDGDCREVEVQTWIAEPEENN